MVEIEDDITSNSFWNTQKLTSPLDHQLAHAGKAILAHQNGRLGDCFRARAEVITTTQFTTEISIGFPLAGLNAKAEGMMGYGTIADMIGESPLSLVLSSWPIKGGEAMRIGHL
eukprot:3438834-Prymnesium_polylepis.1